MATALNNAAEGKINFKEVLSLPKVLIFYSKNVLHIYTHTCVYSSTKTALSHNYLYIAFPYPKYNSLKAHMKITNNSSNCLPPNLLKRFKTR